MLVIMVENAATLQFGHQVLGHCRQTKLVLQGESEEVEAILCPALIALLKLAGDVFDRADRKPMTGAAGMVDDQIPYRAHLSRDDQIAKGAANKNALSLAT